MIRGYPGQPSIFPGEMLKLNVSTDAPMFRVDIYRVAAGGLIPMEHSNLETGHFSPERPALQDWGWHSYPLFIRTSWLSGVYIAVFIEVDINGKDINPPGSNPPADSRDARALFVVKRPQPGTEASIHYPGTKASILYKVSLNTYHAYNYEGDGSLYSGPGSINLNKNDPPGYKVTMRRPGGGTGGKVTDEGSPNTDVYDQSSRRLGFHWDPHFITWLETNRYEVDYCTDLDIHEDTELKLLSAYRLLLSVGHDEYWSEEMRNHVETFIANGGNVAFFSGNTCWWRVHYVDNNTALVCNKDETYGDLWWKTGRPENTLTGVSYRCGGGRWTGEREAVGYTVRHADHWVYEGSGLKNGEVFGQDEHLIGYECDGAFLGTNRDSQGFFAPTGQDHTPSDFKILGYGLLDKPATPEWEDLPQPPKREAELIGPNAATMGIYTNNGTVFTAATTDWVRVLAKDRVPAVEQITHNVLRRLSK